LLPDPSAGRRKKTLALWEHSAGGPLGSSLGLWSVLRSGKNHHSSVVRSFKLQVFALRLLKGKSHHDDATFFVWAPAPSPPGPSLGAPRVIITLRCPSIIYSPGVHLRGRPDDSPPG